MLLTNLRNKLSTHIFYIFKIFQPLEDLKVNKKEAWNCVLFPRS